MPTQTARDLRRAARPVWLTLACCLGLLGACSGNDAELRQRQQVSQSLSLLTSTTASKPTTLSEKPYCDNFLRYRTVIIEGKKRRLAVPCPSGSICIDGGFCDTVVELVCEPESGKCPIPDTYLTWRKVGITRAFRRLFQYTGVAVAPRNLPVRAHLTIDRRCSEQDAHTMSSSTPLDGPALLCAYDWEHSQNPNRRNPDLSDQYDAEHDDVLRRAYTVRHELAHVIFESYAITPYPFQEGFATLMASLHGLQQNTDALLCDLIVADGADLVTRSIRFWHQLCTDYGMTDAQLKRAFAGLKQRAKALGRHLTYDEVIQLFADVLALDAAASLRLRQAAQTLTE